MKRNLDQSFHLSNGEPKNSEKSIQIIVIIMSRTFGRKDASHFLDKWIPIIHQVITYGSILNWGEIISSNLVIELKKVQKEHQLYISSYILDVMYANREFLL